MSRTVGGHSLFAIVITLFLTTHASTTGTIRLWRIGSPHSGDVPSTTVPVSLTQKLAKRELQVSVEAFPAKDFHARFFDAVARSAAPDLLVFDNFGIMDGMTTRLGYFAGIGQDPQVRRHFIRVTGVFDDLLGPQRGWTYLFDLSPNYDVVRALALEDAKCSAGPTGTNGDEELLNLVPRIATAFLEDNVITLQSYADPERLTTAAAKHERLKVGTVAACGAWGNDRLAVARVTASYEGETAVGAAPVAIVLRKSSARWLLLVAARDPVTNEQFVRMAPRLSTRLQTNVQVPVLPLAAAIRSPESGIYPWASNGQRFGMFTWTSSVSEVVAEVVEFAYQNDARLFFTWPLPGSRSEISAGSLWTTRDTWYWRVWSISQSGDVAFSETRSFTH